MLLLRIREISRETSFRAPISTRDTLKRRRRYLSTQEKDLSDQPTRTYTIFTSFHESLRVRLSNRRMTLCDAILDPFIVLNLAGQEIRLNELMLQGRKKLWDVVAIIARFNGLTFGSICFKWEKYIL